MARTHVDAEDLLNYPEGLHCNREPVCHLKWRKDASFVILSSVS